MANNITVLDSTGTSKNWATSEGADSQHRQHVVVTDDDGTKVIGTTADAAVTTDTTGTISGKLRGLVAWFARLGGLDGATFTSGSSYVWAGLGGVYQSTVTTLAAGKSGLARLTARRAVVTAGDQETEALSYAYTVLTGTSYSATITAPKWAKSVAVVARNDTDQAIITSWRTQDPAGASSSFDVFSATIAAGSKNRWVPASGSLPTGAAGVVYVPELMNLATANQFVLSFFYTTPTSGTMYISLIWRS